MRTHIALLRGVNVGGNRMVKMADLRKFLVDIGLKERETLLQSGNLVFSDPARTGDELELLLHEEAKKRLALETEFFVRSVKQWADVIAANPFPREAEDDPSRLIVTFLKSAPSQKEVDAVQAAITGPERIKALGNQLYIFYPLGQGVSMIARTPGWKQLAGAGTARNWNTIQKLAVLAKT
jgi:uncharacterized protein (DUF1697 family)